MTRTWLALLVMMTAWSCDSADGATGGFVDDGSDVTGTDDAGMSADTDGTDLPDDDGAEDATTPVPEVPTDAGSDAAPGLLDPILEYTTCKPEEINPIVDCVLVTCPMEPDPISLAGCLLEMCAPMVEVVNAKCKECVSAAVAQDVAGLLSNCLDAGTVVGGGQGG